MKTIAAYSFIVFLFTILVACDSVSSSPPSTPEPALDVLDWHLAFSSDSQTEIVRCTITDVDDSIQNLTPPVTVNLRSTLITPQILDEALIVLNSSNPLVANRLASQLSDPQYVYVLFDLTLMADRDIFRPFELSPILNPGQQRAFNEIRLFFPSIRNDQHLFIRFNDYVLQPSPEFELPDMKNGEIYAIPFILGDVTWEDLMLAGSLNLEAELAIIPPFQNQFCNPGSNVIFNFALRIASGDSRIMPLAYGELMNNDVFDIRLELLTRILPQTWEGDVNPTPTPVSSSS